MRSNAREAAFKIIFSELFQEGASRTFKTSLYRKEKLNEEETEFADRLVSLTEEHREELSALLTEKIQRFTDNRIYKVDKAIMLVALAEIRYCEDVPVLVSVSEATALARKYSTENSAGFVNGVLGGFINE